MKTLEKRSLETEQTTTRDLNKQHNTNGALNTQITCSRFFYNHMSYRMISDLYGDTLNSNTSAIVDALGTLAELFTHRAC